MEPTYINTNKYMIVVLATMELIPKGCPVVHSFVVKPGETVIAAYKKEYRKYLKYKPVFSYLMKLP
jgi:hypothetical protein